jgi:hypothetical protein
MSLLTVGSTAIAASFLLTTWLVTHGHLRTGFMWGAFAQLPAAAYNVATGQYAFLALSAVSVSFYLRGLRATRRPS